MNQDRGMSRPSRRLAGGSRQRRRISGLSALALLAPGLSALGGCSVGPNFVKPEAAVGSGWREANAPGIKTSRQDYRDWWTAFRDPNLNRLVAIAYDQNLTLMEAGARVLKARAVLGQAIGEVYPQTQQLNGNSDYIQPSRTDPSTNPNNVLAKNSGASISAARSPGSSICGASSGMASNSADAAYLASIASYDDVLVISDRRRRQRLYRHPHRCSADRHRAGKRRQAEGGAGRSPATVSRAARPPNSTSSRPKTFLPRPKPRFHNCTAQMQQAGERPARPARRDAGDDRRAARPFARHPRRRPRPSLWAFRRTCCAAVRTCAPPN